MTIEIAECKAQRALAYQERGTMENMMEPINKGFGLVMKRLEELGLEMSGDPYVAYLYPSEDFEEFDIEVGMPVRTEISESNDVFMTSTFEGKGLSLIHKGPYNTVDKAYSELMAYAQEHAIEINGNSYEFYLNDPDETPAEELLTNIIFCIKQTK